jgi:uncharacterized protein (DUF1697 family)
VAHVVLLRGVNVGGHRTFKPSLLAKELQHLGAVNIGAAGTFVIPGRVGQAQLRRELERRLPFVSEIVICNGRDITRLLTHRVFDRHPAQPGVTRFVSVLSRRPRSMPPLPISMPATGRWLLKVHALDGRFVLGEYRRHMKVIGYLGSLDRIFGVPATTRNWNTVTAIANLLDTGRPRRL